MVHWITAVTNLIKGTTIFNFDSRVVMLPQESFARHTVTVRIVLGIVIDCQYGLLSSTLEA